MLIEDVAYGASVVGKCPEGDWRLGVCQCDRVEESGVECSVKYVIHLRLDYGDGLVHAASCWGSDHDFEVEERETYF